MRITRWGLGIVMLGTAVLGVTMTVAPALAHEDRKVDGIELAVGFGTEPAYVGQPNSAQVILAHDGRPVTDLGDTLKVEVSFGDQTTELPLEPFFEEGEFGILGDYRAWFVPSEPGAYTFRFFGTADGTKID